MAYEKENREIIKCFENIRDIAITYCEMEYPRAPDLDMFIERIKEEIENYYKIFGN